MRSNYWSCSRFADWVRGLDKPGSATLKDWRAWRKKTQIDHPIRYWITEVALDQIQDFVNWPRDLYLKFRTWWRNRYVERTNSLTAHPDDVAPGQWCDLGDRILYCMFNELRDYVEVEKAGLWVAWNSAESLADGIPARHFAWRRSRRWRSVSAGLRSLEGEAALRDSHNHPTYQAAAAQEVLFLYNWWTVTRPARVPAGIASGHSACIKRHNSVQSSIDEDDWAWLDDDLQASAAAAQQRSENIAEYYEAEDQEMLIRLVKVRKLLWN